METNTKANEAKATKKVNRTWEAAKKYRGLVWFTDPKFVALANQD